MKNEHLCPVLFDWFPFQSCATDSLCPVLFDWFLRPALCLLVLLSTATGASLYCYWCRSVTTDAALSTGAALYCYWCLSLLLLVPLCCYWSTSAVLLLLVPLCCYWCCSVYWCRTVHLVLFSLVSSPPVPLDGFLSSPICTR